MSTDYKIIIGQNIRHYRDKQGWNQATLGMLALGYPEDKRSAAQQKIKNIEKGKTKSTKIDDLINIAKTLSVTLLDLISSEQIATDSYLDKTLSIPDDLIPLMPALKHIYGSINGNVKEALTKNINEFRESVKKDEKENENKKRMAEQDNKITSLEKELDQAKKDGEAEIERINKEREKDRKKIKRLEKTIKNTDENTDEKIRIEIEKVREEFKKLYESPHSDTSKGDGTK